MIRLCGGLIGSGREVPLQRGIEGSGDGAHVATGRHGAGTGAERVADSIGRARGFRASVWVTGRGFSRDRGRGGMRARRSGSRGVIGRDEETLCLCGSSHYSRARVRWMLLTRAGAGVIDVWQWDVLGLSVSCAAGGSHQVSGMGEGRRLRRMMEGGQWGRGRKRANGAEERRVSLETRSVIICSVMTAQIRSGVAHSYRAAVPLGSCLSSPSLPPSFPASFPSLLLFFSGQCATCAVQRAHR